MFCAGDVVFQDNLDGLMECRFMCSGEEIMRKSDIAKDLNQGAKKRYSVLLVEDHEIIQGCVKDQLNKLHCDVDVAQDGESAKKRVAENQYDLVILDVGLPDMKGYKVCEYIRYTLGLTVPVVVYSACDHWKKECFDAGVNDFKLKPLSFMGFQAVLRKWVAGYPLT